VSRTSPEVPLRYPATVGAGGSWPTPEAGWYVLTRQGECIRRVSVCQVSRSAAGCGREQGFRTAQVVFPGSLHLADDPQTRARPTFSLRGGVGSVIAIAYGDGDVIPRGIGWPLLTPGCRMGSGGRRMWFAGDM